jgi:AcrR family transcriptional regulator
MAVSDTYRKLARCISCQVLRCVRILTVRSPASPSQIVVGLRERKKARTREALHEAAMDLFSRQGFDRTTVEEIAAACEMSPRTFFRYFPTKEDVLFGDSEQRSTTLVETLVAQPPDLPPLAAIHAAMRTISLTYDDERDTLVARAAIVQGSPGLRAYKVEHQRGWEEALVAGLLRRSDAAHDSLTPEEIRLITAVSMAAFRAAYETWLDEPDQPDIVALVDHAFEQISGGLELLGR